MLGSLLCQLGSPVWRIDGHFWDARYGLADVSLCSPLFCRVEFLDPLGRCNEYNRFLDAVFHLVFVADCKRERRNTVPLPVRNLPILHAFF